MSQLDALSHSFAQGYLEIPLMSLTKSRHRNSRSFQSGARRFHPACIGVGLGKLPLDKLLVLLLDPLPSFQFRLGPFLGPLLWSELRNRFLEILFLGLLLLRRLLWRCVTDLVVLVRLRIRFLRSVDLELVCNFSRCRLILAAGTGSLRLVRELVCQESFS